MRREEIFLTGDSGNACSDSINSLQIWMFRMFCNEFFLFFFLLTMYRRISYDSFVNVEFIWSIVNWYTFS